MTRYIKRGGNIWIRAFPTSRSPASRLKPYGERQRVPGRWVCVVRPGMVLFEMQGVTEEIAREAFRLAAHKLPMKTKLLVREETGHEG